jgi:hypothetical protein
MTGTVVAASGFKEVTELGRLSSQAVGFLPIDEYQFVICRWPSVGADCGYDMRPLRLTQLWTSSNGVSVLSLTKSIEKCIVHPE